VRRYLYAMRDASRRGLKVGVSVDAAKRSRNLGCAGEPLEVLYSREAVRLPAASERMAHWLLRDARIGRSEWFDVGQDQAIDAIDAAIEAVCDAGWVPPWPSRRLPAEDVSGNTFPKRWTETFQMRVDAQFKKDVEAIAKARGLPAGADAIRELVAQEVAQLARKAQPKR